VNILEETVLEVRSYMKILANDIKVYTIYIQQLIKNYQTFILGIFIL